MSRIDEIISMKVDRSKMRVFDSFDELDRSEREYWTSCTPEERLTALEMMRQALLAMMNVSEDFKDFLGPKTQGDGNRGIPSRIGERLNPLALKRTPAAGF